MPRILPVTADVLRAVGAVGGIALIVAGTYDSRWVPFLGCLAVVALSTTELALARMRRWMRATEDRTGRQEQPGTRPDAGAVRAPALPAAVREPHVAAQPSAGQPSAAGPPAAEPRAADDPEAPLGADALLRLLEAVHHELRHAHAAADRAQADLADLSREWNALVQESMTRRPADPPARIRSD
ncbi:hypothetical protein [Kitasatospora sp. NBC_01539]|uniref:hypothetical protein n=1 Tax=Kitasatospora sp. NBC_01539 TaxID=2903577 RepID=UPI0038600CA5